MTVPLTDRGRDQAAAAAEQLCELIEARLPRTELDSAPSLPAPRIISSDQLRAMQTAEVIASRLGTVVEATPLLREQALGDLEGKATSSLEAQPVPEGAHISEIAWGGGESLLQVHRRLVGFVEELKTASSGDVVIVSHGDTLRVLLAVLEGRSHREVEWTPFANGEVRESSVPW